MGIWRFSYNSKKLHSPKVKRSLCQTQFINQSENSKTSTRHDTECISDKKQGNSARKCSKTVRTVEPREMLQYRSYLVLYIHIRGIRKNGTRECTCDTKACGKGELIWRAAQWGLSGKRGLKCIWNEARWLLTIAPNRENVDWRDAASGNVYK